MPRRHGSGSKENVAKNRRLVRIDPSKVDRLRDHGGPPVQLLARCQGLKATQVVSGDVDLPAVERDGRVTVTAIKPGADGPPGPRRRRNNGDGASIKHRRAVTPVLEQELLNGIRDAPGSSRTINEPLLSENSTTQLAVGAAPDGIALPLICTFQATFGKPLKASRPKVAAAAVRRKSRYRAILVVSDVLLNPVALISQRLTCSDCGFVVSIRQRGTDRYLRR